MSASIVKSVTRADGEKRKHLLLVDDEPEFRFSAAVALRGGGYRVSTAEDGREGLAKMIMAQSNGDPFSLLLTDIRMPGMSGLELIDEMRRLGFDMPVVVATGYGDASLFEDLVDRGCPEYLDKPFEPQDLIRRVERLLEKTEKEPS